VRRDLPSGTVIVSLAGGKGEALSIYEAVALAIDA